MGNSWLCSKCNKFLPAIDVFENSCFFCDNKEKNIPLCITDNEFNIICKISKDPDFILALDKLKREDIVEFNLKLSQFKQSIPQETNNIPKCPTCGSANIKKISPTKRWVSTGLLGMSSSLVTHTMECNDCGYKF